MTNHNLLQIYDFRIIKQPHVRKILFERWIYSETPTNFNGAILFIFIVNLNRNILLKSCKSFQLFWISIDNWCKKHLYHILLHSYSIQIMKTNIINRNEQIVSNVMLRARINFMQVYCWLGIELVQHSKKLWNKK